MEDAKAIIKFTKIHMREKLPYLAKAYAVMEEAWLTPNERGTSPAEEEKAEVYCCGMDGVQIFWDAEEVAAVYRKNPVAIQRLYLHLLLHGLYLHAFQKPQGGRSIWWLACDLVTEYRIDRMAVPGFERPIPVSRSRIYRKLKELGIPMEEMPVANWLKKQSKEEIRALQNVFRIEDHSGWGDHPTGEESLRVLREQRISAEQLRKIHAAVHRWRTAFEELDLRLEEHRRQAGGSSGHQSQQILLEKEPGYDFRRFLKQFAVEREELSLDLDSFDYLPYDYSRRMYENLILLEPLEYRDMRRLQEFVIAIDTSGSCSGETVCQFLEEIWEIFHEKENFFREMNLHIIQCDCLIQEHVEIHNEAEWKDYLEHIEIKGHGDTDFTPVFQLIDQMRAEGELRELKGLLYFTDGDGVYPTVRPDYETAFVFLNQERMKGIPPEWIQVLTLDRESDE